ncbi:MAG: hypothetical protein ACP5OK_08980, partial [Thermoprotei archaeon]
MGEAYSEYERAKKGFSAFLILLVSIIFALYEIIIVMGFNFILYNFLRNFGIILPFILVTPDIQQSMAFLLGLIFL